MNRGPAQVPFPVFTVEPGCYDDLAALEGSKVRLTVSSQGLPDVKAWNVAGVLGNPSKQETVILCAHRDHMGTLKDGTLFPGAIDNASGVSAVLELARELRSKKPGLAVVFLFVDSEEAGLDGSRYFAQNLPFPAKNAVVTLNLDCIGVHSAEPMVLNAGGGSKALELADLIVADLSKEGVPAALTEEPMASDHQAFESAGFPAVGLLSPVDAFMEYLHNAADGVDAVDLVKLASITKALAAAVSAFASE
jgi:Zn-dependent M28 family amino/carboxypeptidase